MEFANVHSAFKLVCEWSFCAEYRVWVTKLLKVNFGNVYVFLPVILTNMKRVIESVPIASFNDESPVFVFRYVFSLHHHRCCPGQHRTPYITNSTASASSVRMD
uniref:Ovule protein n=1 Tax=Panagrellus redivivus TaxID=6233 RepID=A0A7E4VC87_PANRE